MSFRRALWAFAVAVCLAAPVAVRAQGDYLDVLTIKVKPEKVADFLALTKRFAEANRKFNGDRWLALQSVYGEANVYQFTSVRKDYADIDKANEAEMLAANKGLGKEGAQKLEQDFNTCIVWSRSESRLLRTTAVHIRPGHILDFEALMKDSKEAGEKNPDTAPVFVSQVVEGNKGAIFYVSTLRSSMGGFDHNPTTKEILGEEGFKKFQQISADSVEVAESNLYRFDPSISNPPEEVAKVAMDFWHPKALIAMAKPKSAMEPDAAKEPTKKPQ